MGNGSSKDADEEQVRLSDFESLKVIGKGSFGKVRIVRHRARGELLALKCISKYRCIKMKAVQNIVRERTILEHLDHPLVCNMRFAFQDAHFMYMAIDIMLGGDLRIHITRRDVSEDAVRFWIAELVCAVHYLHSQGFVHRDIKPDNILLDKDGHIHLSDFNIACALPKHRLLTSQSGTPVYFAPEMYKGQGYNESVDWWSVGITMYECVYGRRPWVGHEKREELRHTVLRGTIRYPEPDIPVSANCLSAIQGFLEHDSSQRLGYDTTGWLALMQHPFFQSIDWQAIETKGLQPPFCPASDTSHFDTLHELDDVLSCLGGNAKNETAPIWHWFGFQTDTTEADKYEKAMKLILTEFRPFDYTIYERYQGFLDPRRMTVGPPPPWVKPAFPSAADEDCSMAMPSKEDATPLSPVIVLPVTTTPPNKDRASRTDSGCTFASCLEESKNKRRSSGQSFRERRERERRRSEKERRESIGTSVVMTDNEKTLHSPTLII